MLACRVLSGTWRCIPVVSCPDVMRSLARITSGNIGLCFWDAECKRNVPIIAIGSSLIALARE